MFTLLGAQTALCLFSAPKPQRAPITRLLDNFHVLLSQHHFLITDPHLSPSPPFSIPPPSLPPSHQTIPPFKLKATTAFADIIVPTVDSVRYMWVLEQLAVHDFHVLCVGPTGTGKTLSISNKLMRGMPEKYSPVFVGFSAQTS